MIEFIKAIWYTIIHPFDVLHLTVVRRYVDAQGNFIGELYDGNTPNAKMIGATCDNWPLNADTCPLPGAPRLCWRMSFLEPLPANTLRVGSFVPADNARAQEYIARRRFCKIRVTVLNRFVERVLGEVYEQ